MGQQASRAFTDEAGRFQVLVDLTRRGLTASSKGPGLRADVSAPETYWLLALDSSQSLGALVEQSVSGPGTTDLGAVRLEATGSISGTFTLASHADPSGTQVYVPGTSYSALTDGNGRFTIAGLPPGRYPFVRVERDGFAPWLVAQVTVPAGASVTLDPGVLVTDPGSPGFEFVGGAYSTRREVKLSVRFPDEALLIMLSEEPTFVGATWQLVQSRLSFTFSSAGSRLLFAKFTNANGLESAPISRSITIDTDPRVTLLSPRGAVPTSLPELDWSDSHIAGARYAVQLTATDDFSSTLVDRAGLVESRLAVTVPLSAGNTYRWRVAIQDGAHQWSWTDPVTFTVDLGAVMLVAPIGTIADSRPTLTWTASPLQGATYRVQVAASDAFATLLEHAEGLAATSYPMTVSLAQGQTAYWRVAVVDANGGVGAYAGPASMTLDLGTVELVSPAPAAVTNDTTPTFSWGANPSAASYTLAYGTAADLAGAAVVTGRTATAHTLSTALPSTPSTTYFWAVTPVDARGVSGRRSEVHSFILDDRGPTGSVTINGGADRTYLEQVTLGLTASDARAVTQMYVSRDGSFTDGAWVPFQASYQLERPDLATTGSAVITAHVKFRDELGNVSDEVTDTIALERTLVTSPIVFAATSWSPAHNPYYVTSAVLFDTSAPLTIEAGTEVYFKAGARIEARGGVSAVGTPASPISLHGALVRLNYANSWNFTPTFDANGAYASGPRFEHVQMADGEIHITTVDFKGPGFYMRNCSLGRITSDGFYYLQGTYIEHSTIGILGDGDLSLHNTKVLNSRVSTMRVNGYSGPFQIKNCELDSLSIDRWRPSNSLEYNNIKSMVWNRPSTTQTAALHFNNLDSAEPVLFRVGRPSDGSQVVDATGNYWGAAATAEMQANTQNIAAVFDFFDDTSLVRVDSSGFLSSPVPGAGPDW